MTYRSLDHYFRYFPQNPGESSNHGQMFVTCKASELFRDSRVHTFEVVFSRVLQTNTQYNGPICKFSGSIGKYWKYWSSIGFYANFALIPSLSLSGIGRQKPILSSKIKYWKSIEYWCWFEEL